MSNQITDALILILDNNRDTHEACLEIVRKVSRNPNLIDAVRSGVWTADQGIRLWGADRIQKFVETHIDAVLSRVRCKYGVVATLVGAAINEVDFDAVAHYFIEKAKDIARGQI